MGICARGESLRSRVRAETSMRSNADSSTVAGRESRAREEVRVRLTGPFSSLPPTQVPFFGRVWRDLTLPITRVPHTTTCARRPKASCNLLTSECDTLGQPKTYAVHVLARRNRPNKVKRRAFGERVSKFLLHSLCDTWSAFSESSTAQSLTRY